MNDFDAMAVSFLGGEWGAHLNAKAAIVGDTATLSPVIVPLSPDEPVLLTKKPDGSKARFNTDMSIEFDEPGLYVATVKLAHGRSRKINVMCFEKAVLDWLPSTGQNLRKIDEKKKRAILSSIVNNGGGALQMDGSVRALAALGINLRAHGA